LYSVVADHFEDLQQYIGLIIKNNTDLKEANITASPNKPHVNRKGSALALTLPQQEGSTASPIKQSRQFFAGQEDKFAVKPREPITELGLIKKLSEVAERDNSLQITLKDKPMRGSIVNAFNAQPSEIKHKVIRENMKIGVENKIIDIFAKEEEARLAKIKEIREKDEAAKKQMVGLLSWQEAIQKERKKIVESKQALEKQTSSSLRANPRQSKSSR